MKLVASAASFLGAALLVVVLSGGMVHLEDDAFITFQYARNLAEFGALTWHVALPTADGFTSLGHTLILSGAIAVGWDIVAANAVVMLLSYAAILMVYLLRCRVYPLWAQLLGIVVITTSADLLFWTSGGLETVLFTAFFFLYYVLFERDLVAGRLKMPTIAVAMCLTVLRPEGMFIAAGTTGFLIARNIWLHMPVRPAIVLAIPIWIAIAAQFVWRYQVYGHMFPSTYYAKQSASILLELEYGLSQFGSLFLDGWGALLLLSVMASGLHRLGWLRLLFIAGICALAVASGGDPHPGYRFFAPLLPLVALDVCLLVSRVRPRTIALAGAIVAVAAPFRTSNRHVDGLWETLQSGIETVSAGTWPFRSVEDDQWSSMKADASWEFGQLFPKGTEIAANDVGTFAYYVDQPVLDTHGLNHVEVAHLPKKPGRLNIWGEARLDHFLEKDVPVVYLWFPRFDRWTFAGIVDRSQSCPRQANRVAQLMGFDDAALAEKYQCVSVPSRLASGSWHNFFVHRGRVADLEFPAGTQITQCVPAFRAACGY